jgi:hypothetical protein
MSHGDVKYVIAAESTAESGLQLDNSMDEISLYDRTGIFHYPRVEIEY